MTETFNIAHFDCPILSIVSAEDAMTKLPIVRITIPGIYIFTENLDANLDIQTSDVAIQGHSHTLNGWLHIGTSDDQKLSNIEISDLQIRGDEVISSFKCICGHPQANYHGRSDYCAVSIHNGSLITMRDVTILLDVEALMEVVGPSSDVTIDGICIPHIPKDEAVHLDIHGNYIKY